MAALSSAKDSAALLARVTAATLMSWSGAIKRIVSGLGRAIGPALDKRTVKKPAARAPIKTSINRVLKVVCMIFPK